MRERVWPPGLAKSLLELEGWRRRGATVFHLLAPPLILLSIALEGVASGEGVRLWIGMALVVLLAAHLLALAVALVLLASKGGTRIASPPGA